MATEDQHKDMGQGLLQHANLFLPGLLGQIFSVLTGEGASVAHEGAGQSHISRQSRQLSIQAHYAHLPP